MYVACKNGMHFPDLDAARQCSRLSGGCGQCERTSWSPSPPTSLSPNKQRPRPEASGQDDTTRQFEDKADNQCPDPHHRTHWTRDFPCPRCCYSESVSDRGDFFKTTTFWVCRYPRIVNWRMVNPEDIIGSEDD